MTYLKQAVSSVSVVVLLVCAGAFEHTARGFIRHEGSAWLPATGTPGETGTSSFQSRAAKKKRPAEGATGGDSRGASDLTAVRARFAELKAAVKAANVRAIVDLFGPDFVLSTYGCRCDSIEGDPLDHAESIVRIEQESKELHKFGCIGDGLIDQASVTQSGVLFQLTIPGNHSSPGCGHVSFRKVAGRWMVSSVFSAD